MEKAKMQGRYQDGADPIKQLDAEIESLQKTLAGEKPTILASSVAENNPLWREFEKGIQERKVALGGLRTRLRTMEEPIRGVQSKLEAISKGNDAFESAEREFRIAEQSYLAFYKRLSEARLSEAMDGRSVANVSVISPPTLPYEPIYPRKLFIMGIVLPAGLVLGIGIAALLESLNDRVRDENDLLELSELPLLGAITTSLPSLDEETGSSSRRKRGSKKGAGY